MLQDAGLLITLTLRQWQARKLDRAVSLEVCNARNNAIISIGGSLRSCISNGSLVSFAIVGKNVIRPVDKKSNSIEFDTILKLSFNDSIY